MFSSRRKTYNLLTKLYNRELFGQFTKGILVNHEPAKQLFSAVPLRLIFPLNSTIPNIGNHILMGATKCGKFLLTYTFTLDPVNELSPCYRYRLHFWSFKPGCQASIVAEVQLFDNSEVPEILTIGIVQWPNVTDRVLVFGYCQNASECEEEEGEESRVYLTVTTTPSPGCPECLAVAASFDEEEMAANWNSGVGLTCGLHGLTFHSWFALPYQYDFNPSIACSTNSQVVINTGSFIHVLEFGVSKPCVGCDSMCLLDRAPPTPAPKTEPNLPHSILNRPLVNRLRYCFLRDNSYSIVVSDTWVSKMIALLVKWINLGNRVEIKELPFYVKLALQKHFERNNIKLGQMTVSTRSLSAATGSVLSALYSRYLTPRPKWFSSDKTNRISSYCQPLSQASDPPDKVYDFKEDGVESCTKYDTFRRRCLANKVYEFRSDEERNVENIRPGARLRPKFLRGRNCEVAKEGGGSELERVDGAVARFLSGLALPRHLRKRRPRTTRTTRTSLTSSPTYLNWMGPHVEIADDVIQTMEEGFGHQPVNKCSIRFKRSYVETDREILSTITDIDDDEIEFGFPCSLPVSVHGAAYAQLGRIPNHKLGRLNVWSAEVTQSSLDVEGVCYVAGERVCLAENYKFKYFIDYDTEIIQVCPLTGDILMVLFIRLNADNLSRKEAIVEKPLHDKRRRMRLYDCQVLVIWSPVSRVCYLEGYSGLTEVCSPRKKLYSWAAAKEASRLRPLVRTTFGMAPAPVRSLVHRPTDSGQLVSSSLILDHDNLIGFKKAPFFWKSLI